MQISVSIWKSGSTVVNWWLRSPNPSNANNVYNVKPTGANNNNNANNSNGLAPDCEICSICSNRKANPMHSLIRNRCPCL